MQQKRAEVIRKTVEKTGQVLIDHEGLGHLIKGSFDKITEAINGECPISLAEIDRTKIKNEDPTSTTLAELKNIQSEFFLIKSELDNTFHYKLYHTQSLPKSFYELDQIIAQEMPAQNIPQRELIWPHNNVKVTGAEMIIPINTKFIEKYNEVVASIEANNNNSKIPLSNSESFFPPNPTVKKGTHSEQNKNYLGLKRGFLG